MRRLHRVQRNLESVLNCSTELMREKDRNADTFTILVTVGALEVVELPRIASVLYDYVLMSLWASSIVPGLPGVEREYECLSFSTY